MEATTSTTKDRLKAWADSYREVLEPGQPAIVRLYALRHHYRDWLDDRWDARHQG